MSLTDNYGFPLLSTGADVGAWGQVLNTAIFAPLDAVLGDVLPITMPGSGSYFLTAVQFQNMAFGLTGGGASTTLVVPLSPNTADLLACGGRFIVANGTSGLVTVITAVAGSTGVVVPQGFAAELYSDGTNVWYASNGLPGYAAGSNGSPNGQLAGTAGSATTNASLAFDYVNLILYVCIATGTATTAVWVNAAVGSVPVPTPQGYLTPVSGTPIITGDAIAQTTLYYTALVGAWAAVYNGTLVVPYLLPGQLSLSLAGLSGILDVYLGYTNPTAGTGTVVIGVGANWGTVTPGSCSRGAGAAIQRDTISGLWVNGTTMTFRNSAGSVSAPAGTLVALGSLNLDSGGGAVTCNRSYGQSRKWGVWNFYNRRPIILQAGDPTGSWTYAGNGVWRQSNANAANFISAFTGLAEEEVDVEFVQNVVQSTSTAFTSNVGVGLNVTTAPSGFVGKTLNTTGGSNNNLTDTASFIQTPFLGLYTFNMIEVGNFGSPAPPSTFFGAIQNMLMTVKYRG